MNAHGEARSAVKHLVRLARDAYREQQYPVMEQLLEQAIVLVEPLEDLPLEVDVKHWLAEARRIQRKLAEAMVLHAWLIAMALDPRTSMHLTDDTSLRRLASGFTDFVWCARQLPDARPGELRQVIEDGLRWLEQVGRPQWAGNFRCERGLVLQLEDRLEEARIELEAAVAMSRRHPDAPGFPLTTYLLHLILLLSNRKVGAFKEAITLAKEVAITRSARPVDRWRAYYRIVEAWIELGQRQEALKAARVLLALGQGLKEPTSLADTWRMLGWLYRGEGRLEEAAEAALEAWRNASRTHSAYLQGLALLDGAEVRLAQARQACRLDPRTDDVPRLLPIGTDGALTLHRLEGARRFLRSARVRLGRLEEGSPKRRELQSQLERQERREERLRAALTRFAGLRGLESLARPPSPTGPKAGGDPASGAK